MNNIDINDVKEIDLLEFINNKNLLVYGENIFNDTDINLEKIIHDTGLDREIATLYTSSKLPYTEFVKKYEEKYKTGIVRKNKQVLEIAYDYLIMFLNSALIVYDGESIVCDKDETNGMVIFSELYDKFNPKGLPYGLLNDFIEFYKFKTQEDEIVRK